jgi:indole-3-glycerol phosphate synthase
MILDEILGHKRTEVARARALESADALARRAERAALRPRGFAAALRAAEPPAIIAELK